MSDKHYSSLDEFVGTLQKQGFKREQIGEIADSIDASQSSYGSIHIPTWGVLAGGAVTGGIVGGLVYGGCAFLNAMARSEPGFLSYVFTALAATYAFRSVASANFEVINEENEKLYQHLKGKFPKIANEVEGVAKARVESEKSALEKKLYTPATH